MSTEAHSTVLAYDRQSAELLVAKRASFKQFVPLFSSRLSAAQFFAAAYESKYARTSACGPCMVCEGDVLGEILSYRWEARFFKGIGFGAFEFLMLALGRIGLRVDSYIVTFPTHRPVCKACQRRLRRRRWLANFLNFIALFVAIVTGGGAAFGWAALVYFWDLPNERRHNLEGASAATALAVLGILCLCTLKLLRVPAPLRFLSRQRFYYRAAKAISGSAW